MKDVNGQPNMLGDGINVAQRVMSFAEPNQILVSRSYYEIVSRLSQEYTRLFQYVGIHRDKHVREHEVYVMTAGGQGATAPAADQAEAARRRRRPAAVESTEFVPIARRALRARGAGPRRGGARGEHRAAGARAGAEGGQDGAGSRRRSASSSRGRSRAAAGGVPASARRAVGGPAAGAAAPAPAAPPARPAPAAPGSRPPLSAEVLAEAAERLAVHIGPVAKLLVKRAAKQASGTRDLYERLAGHIDDPQAPPALRGGDRGALRALAFPRRSRLAAHPREPCAVGVPGPGARQEPDARGGQPEPGWHGGAGRSRQWAV